MSDLWNNLKTAVVQTTNTIKSWTPTNAIVSSLENSKLAQYQFKKAIIGDAGSKDNPYGLVNADSLHKTEILNDQFIYRFTIKYISKISSKIEYILLESGIALEEVFTQAAVDIKADDWNFWAAFRRNLEVTITYSSDDTTSTLSFAFDSDIYFSAFSEKQTIIRQLEDIIYNYGVVNQWDPDNNILKLTLVKNNPKYLAAAEVTKDYTAEQTAMREKLDETIKQHANALSLIGNNETADKIKKLDTTILPAEGGKFSDMLKKEGVTEVPTDETKKSSLSAAIDTNRKPVTKISVESLPRSSVMRESLSSEDLTRGGNTQTAYFDKRPGNAKNDDIYGMESKIDSPGCIKLYKASMTGGYEEPVTIDCFLLQSVQLSLKEKFSVFQSLSGDTLAYFFGKQPTMYRFSAALYNTYNQDWYNDFKSYYENNLRGSASISKNVRTVVSYENRVIEGFFLEMNMQESATNPNIINIDFTILHIQDTVLNYDTPSVYTGRQGDVVTLEDLKKGVTNIGQELLSQIPSGFSTTLSYMLPGAENALIDLTGSRDTLNSLGDIFKDAVEKTQLKSDIDHNSPEYQSFKKMIEYASGVSYRKNEEMLANYKGGKLGKSQFINLFGPIAKENERQTGIPAAVTMAQAILETGWGSNSIGDAKNLFGIKGKGSAGSVLHWTTEEKNGVKYKIQDYFRKYNTWQESVDDHSKFLLTNQRYSSAVTAYNSGKAFGTPVQQNVDNFARGIHAAGYATDSKYSDKLIAIMRDNNLYKWSA